MSPRTGCYRGGWLIYRGPDHPVTGQWRATRHGVGLGAGTREALCRMIDQRNRDEEQRRPATWSPNI